MIRLDAFCSQNIHIKNTLKTNKKHIVVYNKAREENKKMSIEEILKLIFHG